MATPTRWLDEWMATAGSAWALARAADRVEDRSGRARLLPARRHLLRARAASDLSFQRARAPTRHLAPPARLLGARGRPLSRRRSAGGDPPRGRDPAGVLLSGARRASRRAAAGPGDQQRAHVTNFAHMGTRRGRSRRARLPLDDVRRSRPAGGAVRAGHDLPARLGDGAHAGAGHADHTLRRRPRPDRRDRDRPRRVPPHPGALLRAPARRGSRGPRHHRPRSPVARSPLHGTAPPPRRHITGPHSTARCTSPRCSRRPLSATLELHGQPFRPGHRSRFDLLRTILAYRLGDELDEITTPLLVTDHAREWWPGQPQQLRARYPGCDYAGRATLAAPRRPRVRLAAGAARSTGTTAMSRAQLRARCQMPPKLVTP